MAQPILVARGQNSHMLLPAMANRHGLIAGATGTGKTVSLRVLAEGLSRQGVPIFMADVKGDLAGLSQAGSAEQKFKERAAQVGMEEYQARAYPVTFWDVFGEQGHPVRATVSDMGPLLLSRLLNLNDTQSAVLSLVFRVADDNALALLDLKDLRAMIQHVGEHASEYQSSYGNVSAASIGAIQRGLLTLSEQGADKFFGEPMLNIADLMQTGADGRGMINILAASKLMEFPKVYSTFLLWLLSELFEALPEAGDLEKPKLVFFFDEAHLLFNDAPGALLEKIELVVRLIRSKGVGVYFVTQSPQDIPDSVLGQLGNRVQHALRAFSAKDEKAVRAAAQTFRTQAGTDLSKVLTELAVGEALVSFLNDQGTPAYAERAFVAPPESRLGAISPSERDAVVKQSLVFGHYERVVDRESAYERLTTKVATPSSVPSVGSTPAAGGGGLLGSLGNLLGGSRTSRRQTPVEAFISSTVRTIGSQVGRQIVRGVLGSLMRGSSR
ncbi:MAG: DUF853 domain-containing protein [Oligoflexia bacterium]|nr:DUF853 domain-containing protein [Oligoflexia bacterium]